MKYDIDTSNLTINGNPANKRSIKQFKKALKVFAPKPGEPTLYFLPPDNATPTQDYKMSVTFNRPDEWAEIEAERF